MQREGREVSIDYYDTADGAGVRTEWRTIATVDLDQHTANVWKAAQESMIDSMKNTTIDTYEISGEQYFKKADVRKLIKGEPFSVESSPKSDNRFDVPVNIGFK